MSQLAPAAQYIRMSTEHQKYSPASQSAAIAKYAGERGFDIVETYIDSGKSGLSLKGRAGLSKLLADVVGGKTVFKVILVLDVSRWGRFQDPDQSAHYEFICREAGARVLYCVEQFENDGSPTSTLVKNLKRVMAGEYSRDLGVRVLAGAITGARLGFKQGGTTPYGLRRMLVDQQRNPIMHLEYGDHCPLGGYRTVFVHGPPNEIKVVRRIYRDALSGMSARLIAGSLTKRGVMDDTGRPFNCERISKILKQRLYTGFYVFNRTTQRLQRPTTPNPETEWVTIKVMAPVVSKADFDEVQKRWRPRHKRYSNNELLEHLRCVWRENGKITSHLIDVTPGPCAMLYHIRFGGLGRAYREVGYTERPQRYERNKLRRDAELLDGLRKILDREGYISTDLIIRESGLARPTTFIRRWGSLTKAYQAAGWDVSTRDLMEAGLRRRFAILEDQRRKQLNEAGASIGPMPLALISQARWLNEDGAMPG